ncbi:MAG: MoaD/ThiS family protein [Pirellulales bacterium]
MPRVTFTSNLRRHVDCPPQTVAATNVREALEAVFARLPAVASYVVDERFRLRRHVVVFVDGQAIQDRDAQSDVVREDSEIYVMQALSGG